MIEKEIHKVQLKVFELVEAILDSRKIGENVRSCQWSEDQTHYGLSVYMPDPEPCRPLLITFTNDHCRLSDLPIIVSKLLENTSNVWLQDLWDLRHIDVQFGIYTGPYEYYPFPEVFAPFLLHPEFCLNFKQHPNFAYNWILIKPA